jgi:hypothetical protein
VLNDGLRWGPPLLVDAGKWGVEMSCGAQWDQLQHTNNSLKEQIKGQDGAALLMKTTFPPFEELKSPHLSGHHAAASLRTSVDSPNPPREQVSGTYRMTVLPPSLRGFAHVQLGTQSAFMKQAFSQTMFLPEYTIVNKIMRPTKSRPRRTCTGKSLQKHSCSALYPSC